MKVNYSIYVLLLFFSFPSFVIAQVGIGNTNPQGALDIATDTAPNPTDADGLLIPRVSLSNTTTATVITPTVSELVFNTATINDVTPGYYYWDATKWIRLATGNLANSWSTSGNTGTDTTVNFIGTSDNLDFVARTNNTERFRITSDGVIGINAPTPGSLGGGLASPRLELRSDNGSTSDLNISLFADNNAYAALNFGRARGTQLAPTIIQNGDPLYRLDGLGYNGTSFVNMGGISMSVNGVASATSMPSNLQFFTTPNGSLARAARMTINNSGSVGIGTTTPGATMDVVGNIRSNLNNGGFTTYNFNPSNSTILLAGFYGTGGNKPQMRWSYNTSLNFFDEGLNSAGNFAIQVNDTDGLVLDINRNVGIGTSAPTEKLDVNGKTKTTNFQMTSGATSGYVLQSDASGNASWTISSPAFLKIYSATDALVTPLTQNITGSLIYIQNSGFPVFPDDLPDGFTCTIVNYSNFSNTSNTLTTAKFITPASGTSGASSFTMAPGETVNVYVITNTVTLQKNYFIK
ncbi:hypothetical protein [Flavobacterium sp.]|uniref:hypothetical protein n=1 Tax=Flavobacterium sp. TaxID=239 RepID=UPI00375186BD